MKHYGYEFKYSINNVDPDEPLSEGVPAVFKPLLEQLLDTNKILHYPDQLTVNQYQPGQGLYCYLIEVSSISHTQLFK